MDSLSSPCSFRTCLRKPIPEIAIAAHCLSDAVSAHLDGKLELAADLIRGANMGAIREALREWTESLWGTTNRYNQSVSGAEPEFLGEKHLKRMPTPEMKQRVIKRDGYHCRFCGIPVIRKEVRVRIREAYRDALPWERNNEGQHAAFQAMWLQYDHLLPHASGGSNEEENIVITCAPCNYGRGERTLKEVGLFDPLKRDPVRSPWDGLERFH